MVLGHPPGTGSGRRGRSALAARSGVEQVRPRRLRSARAPGARTRPRWPPRPAACAGAGRPSAGTARRRLRRSRAPPPPRPRACRGRPAWPANVRHSAVRMARSTLSRPSSSTSNSASASRAVSPRHGAVGRAPRRSRAPASAAGWRCGACPGRGTRSRPRPRRSSATPRIRADAPEDRRELVGLVVVEAGDEAEAVAQRAGDQPGAGGRADEREPRQVEPDRARRRALADHDVELEVLHRGIEHLLDRARQPVDLVDEQDVAVVEVGEDRGEVAGPLERGPAGEAACATPISVATMPASEVLPSPGGPANSTWSTAWPRWLAAASMISRCSLQPRLADELVEPARAQRRLLGLLDGIGARRSAALPCSSAHHPPRSLQRVAQERPRPCRRRRAGRARRAPRRASSRGRRARRAPRPGPTSTPVAP